MHRAWGAECSSDQHSASYIESWMCMYMPARGHSLRPPTDLDGGITGIFPRVTLTSPRGHTLVYLLAWNEKEWLVGWLASRFLHPK
ncbi:hypothetical protein QC764_0055150 [Podospora pseudoanserina]|uniref:Uncharacterized protein n=1 Tax=Podospora pseudoanserina TaxID=2609844 RepID=A0ABR0IEY0_9PEZI|nr:hypothetical protein QC764_0055150 [Podospora pseudoanserina]